MTNFLNSVQGQIAAVSTIVAVICLTILGLKAIAVSNKQGSIREVISGFGTIVLGLLIISSATAIVTVIQAVGASLHP